MKNLVLTVRQRLGLLKVTAEGLGLEMSTPEYLGRTCARVAVNCPKSGLEVCLLIVEKGRPTYDAETYESFENHACLQERMAEIVEEHRE